MGGGAPADEVGSLNLESGLRRSVCTAVLLAATALVSAPAHAAGEPLVVQTSVASSVRFGDAVEARVRVLARRDAVDVGSIRVTMPVAPMSRLARTRTSGVSRGPVEILTFEVTAACLDQRCVAPSGPRVLHLPRVRVSAETTGGGELASSARWPELTVRGRVPTGVTDSTGQFRTNLDPPPVTYRASADRVSTALLLTAAALAGIAIALAAVRTVRLFRRRREVAMSELERALLLARQAERRSPADRRRAVGLLARVLGVREEGLAGEASTLAWSAPEPTSDSVSSLVDDIGRRLGAR
jgi:hypothetical protein